MVIQSVGRQPMAMHGDVAEEKYGAHRQSRGQHDSSMDFK